MKQITDYWNHNVHYHRLILEAVPPGCRDAIDVGCGDGMLACALAARCAAVTGIDRDALMITLARDRADSVANVTFLEGDFMAQSLAAQVRRTARRLLPGVRYRRHLLWRYSLIWDKPGR